MKTKSFKETVQEKLKGENGTNVKLTWEKVRQIREKYNTGNYSFAKLAKEFNVGNTAIRHIVINKTWKEEPEVI